MEEIPVDLKHNGFEEPEKTSKPDDRAQRALTVFNIILAILFIIAMLAFYERWLYRREYGNLVHLWNQSLSDQEVFNKFINDIGYSSQPHNNKQLLISKARESEYSFKVHLAELRHTTILPRHPELRKIYNNMIKNDQDLLVLAKLNKSYVNKMRADGRDNKRLTAIKKLNLRVIPRVRRTANKIWHISKRNYSPVSGFYNYLQISVGTKY